MFRSKLSLKQLAIVCRSLGTTLQAGVPALKAIGIAGGKASQPALRNAMVDIADRIKEGEQLAEAMDAQDGLFPDLTVDMVRVAEQTGMLPEVFKSLADHYESNLRLRRDFYGQITWPVLQFFAALLIIAFLIILMDVLGSGPDRLDPLGFGLFGVSGALTWLGGWAALLVGLVVSYRILTSYESFTAAVFRAMMQMPVIGPCMEAFAIARFSWAFYLTQEAGMPIDDSLEASLKATANQAFIAATPQIVRSVREGESLTEALGECGLFSTEFVQMVHVGETTGTVPETLNRLSPQFEDQARRSLRNLATAAGWAIWCMVAAFIIFLIFRIVFWYTGMINDAIRDVNR
ncbi:type II secretion system F family protein [Caulifigura coniformis]|nr:type II secretion system F family protein [Caulifigura coniformis]